MSLLIKNVILKGKKADVFVEKNKIRKIGRTLNLKAKEKIDGKGEKAIFPGLVNCHTHATMTLFRGYGDDLPLKDWLEKKIWPLETKLKKEDIYHATKLACLEMLRSGTTAFNDMYWYADAALQAIKETGIRAVMGPVMLDFLPMGRKEEIEKTWNKLTKENVETIFLSLSPHSIYTVSRENLIWAKNFAARNNLILHLHLSETKKEVKDCEKKYRMRPVEFLDRIGLLNKNCILAHSVWVSDREINILGKRKCSAVYNPCSNMKLAVGEIFPYKKFKERKINVCLGTDSAASNNNLDLFEEMKFGSLLQKHREKDPTIAPAKEVLDWATVNGAKALKINAGKIIEGQLADLILIDLNKASLIPSHNLTSDLVYAANGECVSDTICNGKILMRERKVEGEEKIKKEAAKRARSLVNK
jgi:5-methylthioadenosine/S-adenosylhomocysteine deaminase